MWKRSVKTVICNGAIAVVALAMSTAAAMASGPTVTVDDPVGDLKTQGQSNDKGPAYLDITHLEMTKDGDNFKMTMRMAAPIPVRPDQPVGTDGVFQWAFGINTQPDMPKGFPFSPGSALGSEYADTLTWDGLLFHAFFVDRTPL